MMNRKENLFVLLLGLLQVRHTSAFSDRYFNEHPYKYNLLGLSKMLSDYGVENAAVRITDRDADLQRMEAPFVAQLGGEFVIVTEINEVTVRIIRYGKELKINTIDFIQAWTGIALLTETSEKSGEPDYKQHRKTEFLESIRTYALYTAVVLLVALVFWNNALYRNPGISLLIVLNLAGLFVSDLLVQKQLHFSSRLGDKICSLFSRRDCNNVLESAAAKLFGVFGWSEIGAGYFLANILLLLFRPDFVSYLVIINILALPYSLWSVWYQKFRAKQWCGLCLMVQMLLWLTFLTNIFGGYFADLPRHLRESGDLLMNVGTVVAIFGITILFINLVAPKLAEGRQISYLKQELNSLKADENIFLSLLKTQPRHEVSRDDSVIQFGNPDAKLFITILSNPYCNPCAAMHRRIEKFLKDVGGRVCIHPFIFRRGAGRSEQTFARRWS
jgi:uncharacterized membrane protein